MMRLENGGMPHLVVLAPDSDRDRRIALDGDYMVPGRKPTCDVRFDDPGVSRANAALQPRELRSTFKTLAPPRHVCQRSDRSVKWLRTSPPAGHQRADRYSGNPTGAAARPALNA